MSNTENQDVDPVKVAAPDGEISNVRRRAFIKRMARAGAMAPVAALLLDSVASKEGLKVSASPFP